jgi:hypothetical protein
MLRTTTRMMRKRKKSPTMRLRLMMTPRNKILSSPKCGPCLCHHRQNYLLSRASRVFG